MLILQLHTQTVVWPFFVASCLYFFPKSIWCVWSLFTPDKDRFWFIAREDSGRKRAKSGAQYRSLRFLQVKHCEQVMQDGNWRNKCHFFHSSQCVCAYWWVILHKLSVLASWEFLHHHGTWIFAKKFGLFCQGSNVGCRRPRHLHVLMASRQSHLMGIGNYWHWIGLPRIAY